MSNEISWPKDSFYIQSKIGLSNWALTVTDQGAVILRSLTATIDQLWTASPDPRGGAFLKHISTGRVLARTRWAAAGRPTRHPNGAVPPRNRPRFF